METGKSLHPSRVLEEAWAAVNWKWAWEQIHLGNKTFVPGPPIKERFPLPPFLVGGSGFRKKTKNFPCLGTGRVTEVLFRGVFPLRYQGRWESSDGGGRAGGGGLEGGSRFLGEPRAPREWAWQRSTCPLALVPQSHYISPLWWIAVCPVDAPIQRMSPPL